MRIALIDVDAGLNPAKAKFPNLALMRISAYHKSKGDDVEWWWSDFVHYDIVYMSKVFSDVYTKDIPPHKCGHGCSRRNWICHISRSGRSGTFRYIKAQKPSSRDGKNVSGLLDISPV